MKKPRNKAADIIRADIAILSRVETLLVALAEDDIDKYKEDGEDGLALEADILAEEVSEMRLKLTMALNGMGEELTPPPPELGVVIPLKKKDD